MTNHDLNHWDTEPVKPLQSDLDFAEARRINVTGADWSREGPEPEPELATCSWCDGPCPEWAFDFCSEMCRSAAFADMRDDLADEE